MLTSGQRRLAARCVGVHGWKLSPADPGQRALRV